MYPFFLFVFRLLGFFPYTFFREKKKTANSEPRCGSVPASPADCRVQQTSLFLLEKNNTPLHPSLAPCSWELWSYLGGSFSYKVRE